LKKKLETLQQMQEVDIQIDRLKEAQVSLKGEIEGIMKSLDTAREEVSALRVKLSDLEQEKAALDSNLAVEQENIRRSETNMKEIKTNKEFQAVGREITAARKQVTELEEQLLQKISAIDELNSEIGTKAGVLSELEQNSAQRCDEKTSEINAIQQDIDSDNKRRESFTKEIPANVLKRYNKLREQRQGQAVVFARDGYCLGCNMHLPPQLYNNLFKSEELISCPHCQRMLVLQPQAS